MGLTVPGQAEAIERITTLAKFAKGAAAAKLITEATATPGLFVFAEIASCPNIQAIKESDLYPSFLLLEIFSHGTLKDYNESSTPLPPLSEAQLRKLKQLTLIDLATKNKLLSYKTLLDAVALENVRDLEELIMELMFLGTLTGKMNQKEMCLEVINVMARDVIPNQYAFLIESLSKWEQGCQDMIDSLDKRAAELKDSKYFKKLSKDEFLQNIAFTKTLKPREKAGTRKRTIHEDVDFGV